MDRPEEGVCNAGEDLSALIAHFCLPCENPCDWLQVTLADLLVDLQTRKFNYSILLSSYHIQLCYSMDCWFWRPLWAAKSQLSLQWQKSKSLLYYPRMGGACQVYCFLLQCFWCQMHWKPLWIETLLVCICHNPDFDYDECVCLATKFRYTAEAQWLYRDNPVMLPTSNGYELLIVYQEAHNCHHSRDSFSTEYE